MVVLVAANDLVRNLPSASLAAVVVAAGLGLFDLAELRWLWRVRRSEFWLSAAALAGVVVVGVLEEGGIQLAFAELKGPVKDRLRRYRLYDRIGDDRFFPTLGTAIDGYLAASGVRWEDPTDQVRRWPHGSPTARARRGRRLRGREFGPQRLTSVFSFCSRDEWRLAQGRRSLPVPRRDSRD